MVAKGNWLQAAGWTIEVSNSYGSQCVHLFIVLTPRIHKLSCLHRARALTHKRVPSLRV